ncbi:MAG: TonB-dependent receptor [Mucinivorans sp.]
MRKILQWTMILALLLGSQSLPALAGGGSVSLANGESNQDQSINAQSNANKTVTFVVKDAQGQPMVGAMAKVKGTTNAKIVNADGSVTLQAKVGDIVQISFMGFKPLEVPVTSQSNYTATLLEDAIALEEVVVVGFGNQLKTKMTGSVSVVKSDALESRPVSNVGQALQGLVPGLQMGVNSAGGELNNTMTMNIRGGGTIGAGSGGGVLVLIDGMEGNMNALNPQDIDNISVLKDASASAIYGSRAPFGVLLITTKKGTAGKISVNYNNNFRWTDPILTPKMLGSLDFAEYFNLAAKESGQGAVFNPETMGKMKDFVAGKITDETEPNSNGNDWKNYTDSWGNNDWFGVQYKDWAFSHEHNLSVTGGSEKVQYYLSGNLMKQDGLLRFSNDTFDRYSFSAKINAELAKWAKISSSTKFIREGYDRAAYQTGLFYHNIARRWPNLPLTYPKDPKVPFDNPNYGNCNEIEQLRSGGRDISQKDYFYQQLQLVLEPIKGWKIFAEGNFRQTTRFNQWEIVPIYMMNPGGKIVPIDFDGGGSDYTPGMSRVSKSGWKENFFNSNIYTEYGKTWDSGHTFKIMVGMQTELNKTQDVSATGDNLITPDVPTINNTTKDPKIGGSYNDWSTMGIFARANYDYKGRYLFEASVRYDGSSRFMEDKRWNVFPSFSIGWNLANETFMENATWVDMLKLRGSWGQLGNQNTDSWYPYYTNMPIGKDYSWLINGAKPAIYANAPGLISQLMTWENVESWGVALDFAFFRSRLTGTFEVYERTTKNMIGPAPTLPGVLGVGVPRQNNADLKNQGWELQIGWQDYAQSAGISYGISVNVSDNIRTITRYPNETGALNDWYAGRLDGEIWGYTTVGLAQTQEEMDNHLKNNGQSAFGGTWQAGDVMYKDLNGDGVVNNGQNTLDNHGDLSIIGNSTPRYLYGISANIAWKGIDFSFLLQGVGSRDWSGASGGPYFWGADGGMWQSAGFETHLDFWRSATDTKNYFGPNPGGYLPRLSWDSGKNKATQTRYMQDASYIRLKNIQLGYTLPRNISMKFACQKLRFYISADNIATATNLVKTFDPETIDGGWGAGKVYPLSQVISAGLSITF